MMNTSIKRAKTPVPIPYSREEPYNPYGICPGLVKARRDMFQSEISMHELAANLPSAYKRHSATARLAYAYESYLQSNTGGSVKRSTFPSRRIQSTGRMNDRKGTGNLGLPPIESVDDLTAQKIANSSRIENSFSTSDFNIMDTSNRDNGKDISFTSTKSMFGNFFRGGYRPITSPSRFSNKTPIQSPQPINPLINVNAFYTFNESPKPPNMNVKCPNNMHLNDNVLYPSIGKKHVPLTPKSSITQRTPKSTYQKPIEVNSKKSEALDLSGNDSEISKPIMTAPIHLPLDPTIFVQTSQPVDIDKGDINENNCEIPQNNEVEQGIAESNANHLKISQITTQNDIKSSQQISSPSKYIERNNSNNTESDFPSINCADITQNVENPIKLATTDNQKSRCEKKNWSNPPLVKPSRKFSDRCSIPNATVTPQTSVGTMNVNKVPKSPALLCPYNCGSPIESASPALDKAATFKKANKSSSFSYNCDDVDKVHKNMYRSTSGSHPSKLNGKADISNKVLLDSVIPSNKNYNPTVNVKSFENQASVDTMQVAKIKISEALKHQSEVARSHSFSDYSSTKMLPYGFKTYEAPNDSHNPAHILPTPISAKKCRPNSAALSHVVDEMNKLFATANACKLNKNTKVENDDEGTIHKQDHEEKDIKSDKASSEFREDISQPGEKMEMNENKATSAMNERTITSPTPQSPSTIGMNGQAKRGAKFQDRSETFKAAQKAVEKKLKFPFMNNHESNKIQVEERQYSHSPTIKDEVSKPKQPVRSILRPKSVEPVQPTRNRISFAPDDKLTTRHDYRTDTEHGHTISESDVSTSEDDAGYSIRRRRPYDSSEDLSDCSETTDSPSARRARRYSYPRPQVKPPAGYMSWTNSNMKHFPRLPTNGIIQERPKSAPMISIKPYIPKYPLYRPSFRTNGKPDPMPS